MQGIYLVTGNCSHHNIETVVTQAIKAGVCCVQLREKNADTRTFLDRAIRLKSLLARTCTPLIINDRVDIALAAGADGVHLGQRDMPYARARELLGKNALIGLSVETWEDVDQAQDLDLAYIGVSPIFSTPTKTDTKSPWGLEGLARIKEFSRHTLVAIGGLNASNAGKIVRAGADAIAVVSAICGSDDPLGATKRLNDEYKRVLQEKKE
ncbi:MAG: thiamine phosphate synthase [Desulfobacterium sp.]|nr:thiamine phosphate synthase [Desulfobacterium sp.]